MMLHYNLRRAKVLGGNETGAQDDRTRTVRWLSAPRATKRAKTTAIDKEDTVPMHHLEKYYLKKKTQRKKKHNKKNTNNL